MRALGAHRAGRRLQHPVGCPAAAALRLGGLLLRDGHRDGHPRRSRPGPRSALTQEPVERRPPRDRPSVRRRRNVDCSRSSWPRTAGTEPEAVLGAQWGEGQLEEDRVPGQGLEVELVPGQQVGLLVAVGAARRARTARAPWPTTCARRPVLRTAGTHPARARSTVPGSHDPARVRGEGHVGSDRRALGHRRPTPPPGRRSARAGLVPGGCRPPGAAPPPAPGRAAAPAWRVRPADAPESEPAARGRGSGAVVIGLRLRRDPGRRSPRARRLGPRPRRRRRSAPARSSPCRRSRRWGWG